MTSTNIDAAEQIDDFSPTTNTTTGGGGGGGGSMKEKKSNSSGVVVDPAAETTFLHGSTCVVWEGELYTYGGLGEYGEFVDSITRWSGRGENREVTPQNKNMKTDVPPGRYGHTATMSGDYMYVFGGQGRYGAMNDLWVFDFVRATWSPLDAIGEAPRERFGHCACVSENVLFIFGGKDARPGLNVESFEDLYGFDIAEREWLHIESRHGGPSGGEGCALTAVDSVLHVLSPSMPSSATAGGSQMSSSMQNIHSSSSMGGLIAVDETQSAAQLIGSSSQQQIEQSLVLSRRAST
jgi:N-acetylneuraminic acid mutarotase